MEKERLAPGPSEGWFLNYEGRVEGPWTRTQINELLKRGAITPEQLVCRIGQTRWMRLFEEKILSSLLLPEMSDVPLPENGIYLLRYRQGWQQSGPHVRAQIEVGVHSGEVRLTDRLWFNGLKEWQKISSFESLRRQIAELKPG